MNVAWIFLQKNHHDTLEKFIREDTLEIYKLKNKAENAHITASKAKPADSVWALFFVEEGERTDPLLRDFDGEGPAFSEIEDFGAGDGEDEEDLWAGDGDGAVLDFFGAGPDLDFFGAGANGDEDGAWEGAEWGVAAAKTTRATFCPASQWPGTPHR